MEDIHRFRVDLTGSEVLEYHFGLIPSSGLASQFAGDRIMAVGDAAGQATLVAGEGIRLSMQAGLMAGINRGSGDVGREVGPRCPDSLRTGF